MIIYIQHKVVLPPSMILPSWSALTIRTLLFLVAFSLTESFAFVNPSAETKQRNQQWMIPKNNPHQPSRREILQVSPTVASALAALLHLPVNPKTAAATTTAARKSVTDTTSTNQYVNPLLPFSTLRKYKSIQLSQNGLSVLLVSDRLVSRSSCALSVQAGQFYEPDDLPGLAHLMEHMVLSYNSSSTFRPNRDFEEWLSEREGFSNAFTANQKVCFHFSSPRSYFSEGLERFAGLFYQSDVEAVCRDKVTLKREVRRVDSELDFGTLYSQEEYLTKAFVNSEHPYARFSRGSLETLETNPIEKGINVGERLIQFFRENYLPKRSLLVVVGPHDLSALERWVSPFAFALSKTRRDATRDYFPGRFLSGIRYKHLVLFRDSRSEQIPGLPESTEKLSFQWTLSLDYQKEEPVTAPQIAYVLNQILGRRGPGSLFMFLVRRGWTTDSSAGLPRFLVPVDVSGFQILKLEMVLTTAGFLNRASIVSAVYSCIESIRRSGSFRIQRELMAQYATTAKLFAYVLSPRPPDAIELSFDGLVYGANVVGTGEWYRFPSVERDETLGRIRGALADTLAHLRDLDDALIIVTACTSSLRKSTELGDSIPSLVSPKWSRERVSGGLFTFVDFFASKSPVEQLLSVLGVDTSEILPPTYNSLVPTRLRDARNQKELRDATAMDEDAEFYIWNGLDAVKNRKGSLWTLLQIDPVGRGLILPRKAPEDSCRCAFVVQLLSPRPARANVRQSARGELWRVSFEKEVQDLIELGAPGGLAFEMSFNKYGLRLAFLGISQTLSSYTRRVCRRLLSHLSRLDNGQEEIAPSSRRYTIAEAERNRYFSLTRRRRIISNLRSASAKEVAEEAEAFLRSCSGALCFANGDLTMLERTKLTADLERIIPLNTDMRMVPSMSLESPALLDDILYKPTWKPRYASSCAVAGIPLLADACGRIPR